MTNPTNIVRILNQETGLEHTVTVDHWNVIREEKQESGDPVYALIEEPKRRNSRKKAADTSENKLKTAPVSQEKAK